MVKVVLIDMGIEMTATKVCVLYTAWCHLILSFRYVTKNGHDSDDDQYVNVYIMTSGCVVYEHARHAPSTASLPVALVPRASSSYSLPGLMQPPLLPPSSVINPPPHTPKYMQTSGPGLPCRLGECLHQRS